MCAAGEQNFYFLYIFIFFNPSCTVTGARHPVISRALWQRHDGTILTLGPPSACPDKGLFFFPDPGRALDLSKS